VDVDVARGIAHWAHSGQRDVAGGLMLEHVARVAAAVPPDAAAAAWLHDVLTSTAADPGELCDEGLTPVELAALELLTRGPGEVYELYVLRIVHAPGEEGRLARTVMLADLEDRLANGPVDHRAPPYAWARRHILAAQYRRHEEVV